MQFGALTRTVVDVRGLAAEVVVVLAIAACFVALHALLQRRLRTDVLRRHNDVAGYLFSAVGVLYAVVLGFVVVVVWEKYDDSVSNVEHEVAAASDLYHVVDGLPAVARVPIRAGLRTYAQTVVSVEWPAMERNAPVPQAAGNVLEGVAYRINAFTPASRREALAQQAAIGDEQRLFDARRARLVRAGPAVPGVLWFALVVGALAMIAFCYIFGVENRPAQLVMTAILVGFIGILFVVIEEFATPFSGSVLISSDGWVSFQQHLPYIR